MEFKLNELRKLGKELNDLLYDKEIIPFKKGTKDELIKAILEASKELEKGEEAEMTKVSQKVLKNLWNEFPESSDDTDEECDDEEEDEDNSSEEEEDKDEEIDDDLTLEEQVENATKLAPLKELLKDPTFKKVKKELSKLSNVKKLQKEMLDIIRDEQKTPPKEKDKGKGKDKTKDKAKTTDKKATKKRSRMQSICDSLKKVSTKGMTVETFLEMANEDFAKIGGSHNPLQMKHVLQVISPVLKEFNLIEFDGDKIKKA